MEEKKEENKTIIIKRPKRGGHSAHGGAWKVALADFMTSLSLFFIVMWIINMLTPSQKEGVATYFKEFSILENYPKGSIVEMEPLMKEEGVKLGTTKKKEENKKVEAVKEELKKKLEKELSQALAGQLIVDAFGKMIRVQIVETKAIPMFPLGSPELTPEAKGILKVIAENIKGVGNEIAVEGHTDFSQYGSNKYTNWELSTERALKAKRELESNGVDPKRFAQVTGYADTQLLINDNPYDPRNRRISVLLFLDFLE